MQVERSIDIEDEVRKALDPYFDIYCRPLPKNFKLPSLLVTQTSGYDKNRIDNFNITIDSRAETEAEALDLLLDATATLKEVAKHQLTQLSYAVINTCGSWGRDPVRPELAMASAQLTVYTHKVTKNIHKIVKENSYDT